MRALSSLLFLAYAAPATTSRSAAAPTIMELRLDLVLVSPIMRSTVALPMALGAGAEALPPDDAWLPPCEAALVLLTRVSATPCTVAPTGPATPRRVALT